MRRGSRISGAPSAAIVYCCMKYCCLRINYADVGNPPALQPVERVLVPTVEIITFVGPGAIKAVKSEA